jgi:copper chaperone CopZ
MEIMKNTNLSRALVAVFSLALVAPVFSQTAKPSAKMECKDCKEGKGGQKVAGKRDACAVPMTLTLKGLHCEGCEMMVRENLEAVKGVEEVSVSAKKQQAVVWVCSHKNVKPDALKAAVKKAGYNVLKVEKGEPKADKKS